MSVYEELIDDLTLWPDWEERFSDEYNDYITPNNPTVVRAVNESDALQRNTPQGMAESCWQWVITNTEYKISKEWKTPEETINSGVGDCEDVTFLIASMVASLGVSGSKVVAGYLTKPNGEPEPHTWNVVDGMIVDATGSPSDVQNIRYDREFAYTIMLND